MGPAWLSLATKAGKDAVHPRLFKWHNAVQIACTSARWRRVSGSAQDMEEVGERVGSNCKIYGEEGFYDVQEVPFEQELSNVKLIRKNKERKKSNEVVQVHHVTSRLHQTWIRACGARNCES